MNRALVILCSIVALSVGGTAALADSTPVGALPPGPVASLDVQRGELVALAVPKRDAGKVWRVARQYNARVLHQVSEARVGSSIVMLYRAGTAGRTTIALALTAGDTSAKALESRQFRIHVR
jgi:hypothetical protein